MARNLDDLDLSQLPDQGDPSDPLKGIDLSGLPDKGITKKYDKLDKIDLSGLPDQGGPTDLSTKGPLVAPATVGMAEQSPPQPNGPLPSFIQKLSDYGSQLKQNVQNKEGQAIGVLNAIPNSGILGLSSNAALGSIAELNGIYNGFTTDTLNPSQKIDESRVNTKVPSLIGSAVGQMAKLYAIGSIIGAPTMGASVGSAIEGTSPTAARIIGGATSSGLTFGASEAFTNAIQQVKDGKMDIVELGKNIFKEAGFGAGLGAIGATINPLARIAGLAAYGFGTSLMKGNSVANASIDGAVQMAFGAFDAKDVDLKLKQNAYEAASKRVGEAVEQGSAENGYDAQTAQKAAQAAQQQFASKVQENGGVDNFDVKNYESEIKNTTESLKQAIPPKPEAAQGELPNVNQPDVSRETETQPIVEQINHLTPEQQSVTQVVPGSKPFRPMIYGSMEDVPLLEYLEPKLLEHLEPKSKPNMRATVRPESIQTDINKVLAESQAERIKNNSALKDVSENMDILDMWKGNQQVSPAEYQDGMNKNKSQLSKLINDTVPDGNDKTNLLRQLATSYTPASIRNTIKSIDNVANKITAIPGQPIKSIIDQVTGVSKIDQMAQVKQSRQIQDKLRSEASGSRVGFREGVKITRQELISQFRQGQENISDAIQYIKQTLPPQERGKFIKAAQQATSGKKLYSLIQRVNVLGDALKKEETISDIKELSEPDKRISIDFQDKISNLTKDIDFKRITPDKMKELKYIQNYILKNASALKLSPEKITELQRLNKMGAHFMDQETAQSVRNQIEQFRKLGYLKQFLKIKYQKNVAAKAIAELASKTVNIDPGEGKLNGPKQLALKYYMANQAPIRAADFLDGNKNFDGPNAKYMKQFMRAEGVANDEKTLAVNEAMDRIAKKDWSLQDQIAMTYHLAKDQGAAEQMGALKTTYGLKSEPIKTPGIQQAMDVLREIVGRNYADINAILEETENRHLGYVKNYFPFMYEGESDNVPLSKLLEQQRFFKKYPNKDFTFERLPGVKKNLRVDNFKVFETAMGRQSYYKNIRPIVENVKGLFDSPEYARAAGRLGQQFWRKQLDIISRRGHSIDEQNFPFLKTARINITKAALAYHASTILVQPFHAFNAMAYAQQRWGPKAAAQILGEISKTWINPIAATRYAKQNEYLRNRGYAGEVSLEEALGDAKKRNGLWNKVLRNGFKGIHYIDILNATAMQKSFEKILSQHGLSPAQAKVESENLVRAVGGSSEATSRPQALAYGDLARLFYTFTSFFNNRFFGIVTHDIIGNAVRNPSFVQSMNSLMALMMVSGIFIAEHKAKQGFNEAISGKKHEHENLMKTLLSSIPGQIPLFGGLLDMAVNPHRTGLPPVMNTLEDVFAGGYKTIAGTTRKERKRNAFKFAKGSAALGLGVPGSNQAFELAERLMK